MKKKITLLFALLCASMMSWAGQFCNTLLTADNAAAPAGDCWNDEVYFTASKTGDFETTFSITSTKRTLTGTIFNGQALMQNPGGGTLDGNFAEGWTLSGNTLTKVAKWSVYPTGNIQVYIVIDIDNNGAPITGAQIPNLDVSSACGGGDPTPDPDPEPTEIYDVNFALQSQGGVASAKSGNDAGLANNGNTGDRWWSSTDAPMTDEEKNDQWWQVDLGKRRIFNTIQIVWEGAWGKSFNIQISKDGAAWTTVKEIRNQNIPGPFPYEQTIELDTKKTARYVRFQGIERGTVYAYSFWEFRVFLAGVSVLTSISLTSPATIAQVSGAGVALVATPKDQNGQNMEAEISWEITPATAGHMSGNTYIPDQIGVANIRAYNGEIFSPAVTIAAYTGTNVALNKTDDEITASGYDEKNDFFPRFAVDDNDGSFWSAFSGETGDERVYDAWINVDLGAYYDINLIAIRWEGACSRHYHVDFSADNSAWRTAYNAGWNDIATHWEYLIGTSEDATKVRYVRVWSTEAVSQYGVKIMALKVYGSESSTLTKSVSASVNDPAMGTATVTQNDAPVTEVATGSTVTFSATPNDGYIFVDWSNGNTNATFNATVDAAMNLTANFRALNHICCNEEMTNGDYTAYVTYKKTANDNEYVLIVRSAKEMVNFTNAYVGHINGNEQINMNGKGVLSGNGHMLSYTFTSTTEPKMNTPLYINFAGHGEVTFNQINNSTVFEFSQPCADPEITAIELNKTAATLDMGNTLTLVPTFTPAYMSADITWLTSDAGVATVDNGIVTPVAAGNVTITAKVTEDIKATCAVTVQNAASHNWYGYGTDKDLDYTYCIEYTTDHHIVAHVKRQGNKIGLVDAKMLISGVWTYINNTEGEEEGWKKGTTEATFTAGNNIHILIQSDFSGASSIIEFDYEVGSDNVMPTIVPSTLALSNTNITMGISDADVQLTAEIHHRDAANKTITWTSDDESVVTVVNGLVHPVGVGKTTVHAATFNGISATCEVTVVGTLEPTIFWGSGESDGISILYSITRNADHTLTYAVEALHNKDGFELRVHDDDWHNATLNEGIYTWSSTATYTDGNAFDGFFYMPFDGGAGRVDFHYVVGSESEKGNMPIRLYEDQDNSFMLTASDGLIRDVKVTRSFTSGDLYTLVLPFDVDAAQTAAQLPGQLTKLQNTSVKENGDLRINFVNASAVEAGVPYLYQPSADVTNLAFVGVTVSKNLNPSKPADNYAEYHGIYAPMDGDELHALTNAYVLGPDQYLYAVSDLPANQTMKALRAYFKLNFPETTPGSPKRLAKVVFNENETETTTDIEDLQTDIECTKVIVNGQLLIIRDGKMYNVQGQLVK